MGRPVALLIGVALGIPLSSCGDPGYSFGRYDEQLADVAPLVDRYCTKAMECAPHAIAPSFDECRIVLFSWLLEIAMECTPPFEALIACADRSRCFEFPILSRGEEGSCGAELRAFETCASSMTSARREAP